VHRSGKVQKKQNGWKNIAGKFKAAGKKGVIPFPPPTKEVIEWVLI
jgi:hypothetical protein